MRKTLLLILLLIPLAGYGQSWQIGASVGSDYNSAHRTYIKPYQKQDVRGGFSPSYNLTFSREYKNSDLLSISFRYTSFMYKIRAGSGWSRYYYGGREYAINQRSPQIDISYHKIVINRSNGKFFLGKSVGFGMNYDSLQYRPQARHIVNKIQADFYIPIGLSAMYQYRIT